MALFPKPGRGSGTRERRARKQRLVKHRQKVNLQVLERDSYKCKREGCGNPAIHGHHVFGRGGSPEHDFEQPEKRLSLCNDCHYSVHHGAHGDITRADLILDLERVLAK